MGRRRGIGLVTALVGVLALTACQDTGAQTSQDPTPVSQAPSGSVSPTPTGSSSPAAAVADPEHAVPAPGPRTGAIAPPDLLVLAQDTLSDDVVKHVRQT